MKKFPKTGFTSHLSAISHSCIGDSSMFSYYRDEEKVEEFSSTEDEKHFTKQKLNRWKGHKSAMNPDDVDILGLRT